MKTRVDVHEESDLLARLNRSYKTMSKGQKQIAAYILDNYDRAAFITASKMGRIVGVSESTVVRFAYSLNYDGYPELQKSLQELIRNKLTSVQRIQLSSDMNQSEVLRSVLKADMSNLRYTIESIDNKAFESAVDAIMGARTVYVVGLRSTEPLAMTLSYYLGFVVDDVVNVALSMGDVYENMIRIGNEDVCIGISFPRYSSRTIDAFKFAKTNGARLVALTDSASSPIAEIADECLIARSNMASFADSLVAPLSLINALIVACSLRKKEDVFARFAKLEALWNDHGVYVTKEEAQDK